MSTESPPVCKETGVFELLTDLCGRIATNHGPEVPSTAAQKQLANRMRSYAFEIILKKSSKEFTLTRGEPIVELLSYYFILKKNVRNVAEHNRAVSLKKAISRIRQTDFGEDKTNTYDVLRLLVALSDSVKEDHSSQLFKNPFTFGKLDEMLPRLPREAFGSAQPYTYYPGHIFDLPYSLKQPATMLGNQKSQTYTDYTVETFDSRSLFPDNMTSQKHGSDIRTFQSPMSLASLTSTSASAYSDSMAWNFPRLMAPRDIQIPKADSASTHCNVKVTFASRETVLDVKEVFRADTDKTSVDIWELATQIDKDIPNDIWDVASKMPVVIERRLIASSSREVALWRKLYADQLCDLDIIPEKQFIRHMMYLLIGVETSTFPFCADTNTFYMKEGVVLEGISKEHLTGYVSDLLLVGTYYRRLYVFAFNVSAEDRCHSNGLVYEAAREVIRRYLLEFRLRATEIYEDTCRGRAEAAELNNMPTLLRTLHHVEPLKRQIETVASIYKLIGPECKSSLPSGAELMSYLFDEISLVTHQATCITVFNSLFSICSIYFKFIERFVFDGELEDKYSEFFIRKDPQYVGARSKRYWDKGFHLAPGRAVPGFLRPLAKFILLCGKSLRLLKQCNPNDPLVLLISSDHPTVKCCATFEELERQQQLLDVYRTRCLFVSGEPMTFEQILLNREAERKAFAEMASIKQAETMEKIFAERKRLAQLIIAEKQHSLRVLEAAMAEAKAAKQRVKQRERKLCALEREAEKATEEVDSKLKDIEKNELMEYYSKLNMEVEKSKIHTEWKMKRLQLGESRMQLLSTEERNLKREKLELEHQKNEEIMAMSTQSIDTKDNIDGNDKNEKANVEAEKVSAMTESTDSFATVESYDDIQEHDSNKTNVSSQVFSAICSVAKSVFGRSRNDSKCDNKSELDSQGNLITVDSENNKNTQPLTKSSDVIGEHFDEKLRHVPLESENTISKTSTKSSDAIGGNLNEKLDNEEYLKARDVAMKNKLKVMGHEFHQTDEENNRNMHSHNIETTDEENNDTTSARSEAKRNKLKVLGAEFAILEPEKPQIIHEPVTEAQKQALINKKKVLGVEYNLPIDNVYKREPACKAQEEAIQNKQKILGSEHVQPVQSGPRRDLPKRSGLTLNLKPYSEMSSNTLSVTPNTGAITPGDFFPALDLETPTTADVPLEGAMTADVFTPDTTKGLDEVEVKVKPDKELLGSESFNLSLIVDEETVGSDGIDEITVGETPQSSPSKSVTSDALYNKYSLINLIDGTYSFEDFDPFGVRELKSFSKDHFTSRMNLALSSTSYTHPAIIMQETNKKPYANIFASHLGGIEEVEQKINSNNIATLTACLQRSVMLPLTYQLEVVNNSILTYFLVNLDMYDHMRSLKDYFFLMDGEFSRTICNNLFARLTKTLNPQELLNFATLHNILDKALGSSISHVPKFSDNLSFTITESPLSFQHSSPDVLQCLSLTYSVSWPLNIILSQEALLRYARVFQFLVKMRRISWVLGEDFESLKLAAKLSREHSHKLERSPQYVSVQLYRHIMASMIRALDNYIVTTCILSSWKEFENDLKKARTLDDLYDCHVVYIKKVLFRCLLNNRSTPVMKLLNDIFTVILKFSRLLKAGEWQQTLPNGHFTHTSYSQLEEFFHLFEKLAKYLHKVITKLMECGYQRHLVELLAMINLNGYYDTKPKEEVSISVQST